MTVTAWITIFALALILTGLAWPRGTYMAAVFTGRHTFMDRIMGVPEHFLYRLFRVEVTGPGADHDWKRYARSVILFSLLGWLLLYFILRTQTLWNWTGLNPEGFHSAPWNVTFNTVSSFVTNTNWQYYGGETTMSYFSQMAGLTVQNVVSAAVGICVAIALIRGITSHSGKSLGNFWQDLIRTILYVLLPLSIVLALVLVFQGSIQTFGSYVTVHGITGLTQTIARAPVASQEAIKLLGTNGGGIFNTNSAHPYENPTGFTNLVRDSVGPHHPGVAGVHVRPDGRQPAPGPRQERGPDLAQVAPACPGAGHRLRPHRHAAPARRPHPTHHGGSVTTLLIAPGVAWPPP
jgi:K+-transporting ATPase ATPase A chain